MDDRIAAVVRDIVAAHGFDLDDITLGGGKRRMLRVVVDAEGGVGIDALGRLSREISQALDTDAGAQAVVGAGAYTLEVTSRGTDRPLVIARHWQRNVGRLVAVTPIEGDHFTGRVAHADEEAVTLQVAGSGQSEERVVPYTQIRAAVVQVELNRKKDS
ncbi:MAG: ribosome maturation factor RimP [Aeromicrobium sp.]|uniref:ribosome maturation factor RimP n=1 Tax=Aeromicrobium sp. TaxID=1871063 RepID=UPI0039E4B9C9